MPGRQLSNEGYGCLAVTVLPVSQWRLRRGARRACRLEPDSEPGGRAAGNEGCLDAGLPAKGRA